MEEKIKPKTAVFLIILLLCSLCLQYQPSTKAQSANIVNYTLTFHNYSLLLRETNNSFYVYDGADGAAADATTAGQVDLESQISGQRDGWNYWSAIAMWTVKLPMDLHVVGTVNVKAYISSTYKLSGLFSGGGYGMSLVDIDENNNEAQEFITEAPYTVGGNPFTATPTAYSTTTNIDYTFVKGHSIGFAVGLGATTQGFSATVYFGSPDRNSGATLPVVDTTQSCIFTANGAAITVEANSAITNTQYDATANRFQFNAQGINYTPGHCTVSIPKTLMQTPFTITQGSQQITPTVTENSTHYQLSFDHTRNINPIQIAASTVLSSLRLLIFLVKNRLLLLDVVFVGSGNLVWD